MNIKDYLFEGCIKNDVELACKEDAIDLLIELHEKAGNINNKTEFKSAVIKRDEELSTALETGVAIPHAKSGSVIRPALAKISLKAPISWDGRSVSEVYLLASPSDDEHLKMLSALADALQNGKDVI